MNFNYRHYVPVLKIKQGEKAALQNIQPALQPHITPLLEVVERVPAKNIQSHLETTFKQLAESTRPYTRCFIDTREIAPDGPEAATAVFQRAQTENIVFTPITGISRTADVVPALSYRTNGLGIRLTRDEFEQGNLTVALQDFMRRHNLSHAEVDLIVDLGPINDFVVDGVIALTNSFLASVPDHPLWKTLTVSACGFPSSMGIVDRNSHELVDRVDWLAWRNNLFSRRSEIPRLPTFSDCAIQHSKGVEGFDPITMKASAAIRHTSADSWLLIKGVSIRSVLPTIQFRGLASQLVTGELREHFRGPTHCGGCSSVQAAASGAPRLGSLGAWRRLGTIHHITTVVEDLSALP
ncbi:MAG TPA: hypothetical protein VMU88_10500 [bacterium]|nr:hypothetical protein [bacterium]